jgi:hypothetical protein
MHKNRFDEFHKIYHADINKDNIHEVINEYNKNVGGTKGSDFKLKTSMIDEKEEEGDILEKEEEEGQEGEEGEGEEEQNEENGEEEQEEGQEEEGEAEEEGECEEGEGEGEEEA